MRQPVADLVRQGLTAAALTPPDIAGAGKGRLFCFPPTRPAGPPSHMSPKTCFWKSLQPKGSRLPP